MKKRFALICLIIGAIALAIGNRSTLAAPQALYAGELLSRQILQSTVQIIMYENSYEADKGVGRWGLGTLVRHDDQTLVITHDHWSLLNAEQGEVDFRSAQGALLLRLAMNDFRALIRYLDGGTMVLVAPLQVAIAFVPATVTSWDALQVDERLWVVRRAPQDQMQLEVIGVSLEELQQEATPARLRLRGAQGAQVAPGTSGGGVWMDGKLVGNIWSGGMTTNQTSWQRLTGEQSTVATNLIIAALQPLAGLQDDIGGTEVWTKPAFSNGTPSMLRVD